jgi:recombinational DNA repair protein (RecF pathway)
MQTMSINNAMDTTSMDNQSTSTSDALKQWQDAMQAQQAKKDTAAHAKHQETLEKARREIDAFYADYNQVKVKQHKQNRCVLSSCGGCVSL